MTLVLAHRGANRQAPENTLAAFTRAARLGADGVELDVRRTADGSLVVHHDAVTPAGLLAGLTLREVRARLPEVPTLGECLDACAPLLVNVEIKNLPADPDWDPSEAVADALVDLLAARGHRDRVLVSSFNLGSIDRVRELAPTVPTGLLTWGVDPLDGLARAEAHGHTALHPDARTAGASGTVAFVARAHDRGLLVNVWTVNAPGELARLAAAGVDAVITDVPDVALDVLRGRRS